MSLWLWTRQPLRPAHVSGKLVTDHYILSDEVGCLSKNFSVTVNSPWNYLWEKSPQSILWRVRSVIPSSFNGDCWREPDLRFPLWSSSYCITDTEMTLFWQLKSSNKLYCSILAHNFFKLLQMNRTQGLTHDKEWAVKVCSLNKKKFIAY